MHSVEISQKEQKELLSCVLPQVEVAPLSHQYGSRYLAANYCGFDAPPREIPGEWQHGWLPEFMNWHPEAIVGYDGLSRHRRKTTWQFVARKDQQQALRNFDYQKVASIGHPIIYLEAPMVKRLEKSLLVMPVHSIATTEHQWDFDDYAETIKSISRDFSKILICINPSCIQKGYWVEAFRKRGFPIVSGAFYYDKNAYQRISILMKRFEFVTSNGFGSHLAYAQYFGAKTSIFGQWPLYRKEDYVNDPIYQRCPELLDFHFSKPNGERIRDEWPWLFVHPTKSVSDSVWASSQLGVKSKKNPQELKQLFEWDNQVLIQLRLCKVRSRVEKLLKNMAHTIHYVFEPKILLRDIKLAQLRAGLLKKVVLDKTYYKISNGPQAAREYLVYHQNKNAQILTNPNDAPLLDLVPSDGIALNSLREDFPDRPIYSIASRSTISLLLNSKAEITNNKTNIHSLNIVSAININKSVSCCDIVNSFAVIASNISQERTIIQHAGVIRCQLCPNCKSIFFECCKSLSRLSLLIIEFREKKQPSLNSLSISLNQLDFKIQTHSIRFFSEWQNADSDESLTYLCALRLGDAQRSVFH